MRTDYLELFHEAINNLRATTRNDCIVICDELDQTISINSLKFYCDIKKTISNANIFSVVDGIRSKSSDRNMPMVLITDKIYPKLANTLSDNQINWIDKVGNCDIRHKSLIIKIAGQKDNTPTKPSSTSKISEIQEKVGLSLGTITKAFDLLKAKQYLVQTEKGRKISMREELVEWWQQQYNEFLKPKLLINRMTFRSPEHRRKWKEMLLPEGMYWGGDCGANLVDGYLIPGEFEIYSDVASSLLLRTGAVMPAPNGEIHIYKKFWIGESKLNLAPKLVIYADLMGAGDSRCHEAALRIKENGI